MTNNDDLTRDLNDRIKELEDMTKELEDMTTELDDQATQREDTIDEESNDGNTASLARQEGDSIFFSAIVDVEAPLVLRVNNTNGDIHVTSSEGNQLEIQAECTAHDAADHTHWFFQQIENEITLRPNWQVGNHVGGLANKLKAQFRDGFKSSEWSSKDFKFGLDVSYDLTVRLPATIAEGSNVYFKTANGDIEVKGVNANLDVKNANGDLRVEGGKNLTLHTANGDIEARGARGNISAATANGDIQVQGATGTVDVNSASGDIDVDGVTGWITLRSASGDVRLQNATVKGGRVASVSGDMDINATFANRGTFGFDSVSGNVNVQAILPNEGATLTSKSVSGDTHAEGWTTNGKNSWTIGEGTGITFTSKSVSGDIYMSATLDNNLTLTDERPAHAKPADGADSGADESSKNDVNINLDLEIERAKGWLKDLASRFSEAIEVNKENAPAPQAPEVPVAPVAPEPPLDPVAAEAAKSATAVRRAELLEKVKNGELSVDEALAQLDQNA